MKTIEESDPKSAKGDFCSPLQGKGVFLRILNSIIVLTKRDLIP